MLSVICMLTNSSAKMKQVVVQVVEMALERGRHHAKHCNLNICRHAEHCDLDNIICQSEMHFNVTKSNCKFHFTFLAVQVYL